MEFRLARGLGAGYIRPRVTCRFLKRDNKNEGLIIKPMKEGSRRFNLRGRKLPEFSARTGLLVGLILANAFVLFVIGLWQIQSREEYEERTRVLTQNIAAALNQNISRNVTAIDLGIRAVVDELERHSLLE